MIDERQQAVDELKGWVEDHPAQFSRGIAQAERDLTFSLSQMRTWQRQHPNSWMAVFDATLVAVESTREALLETLRERGIPALDTYVFYVHDEQTSLIL